MVGDQQGIGGPAASFRFRVHIRYPNTTGRTDRKRRPAEDGSEPLLAIGLRYIRFAAEEPHLFRFLFQSGYAGPSLTGLFEAEELTPVLGAVQEAMGTDAARTKAVFRTLALVVHGYASLLANNALPFNEEEIAAHLRQVYAAEVLFQEEAEHEKDL